MVTNSSDRMAEVSGKPGDVDEDNDPNMGTLYEANIAPTDRDTSPPPPFKDWNQGSGNFVRRTSKSFRTSLSKVMGAGRLSDIDLEDGQTDKMLDRMDQDSEGDALFTISRSGDVGVCGRRRCGLISCLGCLLIAAALVILFTDNNLGVLHGKFPGQTSPTSAPGTPVGDDDLVISPPILDDDDDDFVPPRPPTVVDDDDDDFVVPGQPPVVIDDDDDFVVPGQPPIVDDDDDDFVVPGQPPIIDDDDDDFVVPGQPPQPPIIDDDDFVIVPPIIDDDDDDFVVPGQPPQPPIIDDDDDFVVPPPPVIDDDDDFVIPPPPPVVVDDDDFVVQPPIVDDDDDFIPPVPPVVEDDDDFIPPIPPVVEDDDDFIPPNPPVVLDDDDFVFVPPVDNGLPLQTTAPVQQGTTGGQHADWQIEDTQARVWGFSSRLDLSTGASVEGNKPHEDTIFLVNRSGFFSEDVTFEFDNLDSIEFNRIYVYDAAKNEIAFERTWYNDDMTEQYTSGTIFETTMDVAVLHELIKEEIHSRHPNHNVSFV